MPIAHAVVRVGACTWSKCRKRRDDREKRPENLERVCSSRVPDAAIETSPFDSKQITHRLLRRALERRHSAAPARVDVPVLSAVVMRGLLWVAGRERGRPAAGRGDDRAAARAEGEAEELSGEGGVLASDDGRTRGRGAGDDARGELGTGGDV